MAKDNLLHVLVNKIVETTKVIIFDLVRSAATPDAEDTVYEILEMLKDGVLSSGKYDSTTRYVHHVHAVVFSNYPPRTTAMSADRWKIREIGKSSTRPSAVETSPEEVAARAADDAMQAYILESIYDTKDPSAPTATTPAANAEAGTSQQTPPSRELLVAHRL